MHILSADNVLLCDEAGDLVPKLTGFAHEEHILQREKLEMENVGRVTL